MSDDELFDDLHEGVEALRSISKTSSIVMSEKAVESLRRLESTVPAARNRLRKWKEKLKDEAMMAAQHTDQAAHKYPWIFTLSGLGLGFLAGLVLTSSDNHDDE